MRASWWKVVAPLLGVGFALVCAAGAGLMGSGQAHADVGGSELISGTVVDAAGKSVSGATVSVVLWPNELPLTGSITPQPVAWIVTGADGSYDLSAAMTPAIQAAENGNGGVANFELDVSEPHTGLMTMWMFPASLSVGSAATIDRRASAGKRVWRSSITGGVTRHRVRLALGAPGVSRVASRFLRPVTSHAGPPACPWLPDGDLGTRLVVVGEVHSWTGMDDTFSYGSTADTSVEVGITGTDGKTSVGGAIHVGNSSSSGTTGGTRISGRHANGNRVMTKFDVRRLKSCVGTTMTQVYRWNGLDVYLGDQTVQDQDGACSRSPESRRHTFPLGQAFWNRNKNDATWFSAAISIGPFSLSSTSGYSTNVQSHWDFSPSGSRTLCGNDAGIGTAHRVFAGA